MDGYELDNSEFIDRVCKELGKFCVEHNLTYDLRFWDDDEIPKDEEGFQHYIQYQYLFDLEEFGEEGYRSVTISGYGADPIASY